MEHYRLVIDSGIAAEEIIAYFHQVAKPSLVGKIYYGKGWQVEITPMLPRQVGVVSLPRTQIVFWGHQVSCETAIVKYRKKFMRGGG